MQGLAPRRPMAGLRFAVPEIADYEVRRELTRIGSARGLAKLDEIAETFSFLPVDRSVWLRAADLWARARNAGIPTAADAALDGDVILAATAQVAAEQGDQVIVVSANTRHLGRFVDAKTWESLRRLSNAQEHRPVTPEVISDDILATHAQNDETQSYFSTARAILRIISASSIPIQQCPSPGPNVIVPP